MAHVPSLSLAPSQLQPPPSQRAATKARVSNFAPAPSSAAAGKRAMAYAADAGAGTATTASSGAVQKKDLEMLLIANLRQQVAVLEAENAQLKRSHQETAMGASVMSAGAASLSAPTRPLSPARSALGGIGGGTTLTHHHTDPAGLSSSSAGQQLRNSVVNRVNELQAEVERLKRQYAQREQEHAVELAELRGGGASLHQQQHRRSSAAHATGLPGSARGSMAGASGSMLVGAAGEAPDTRAVRDQASKEIAKLRERHTDDIVRAEKTIDRLRAELSAAKTDEQIQVQKRDDLTKELVAVKDTSRGLVSDTETLKKEKAELERLLQGEQETRRNLETTNKELHSKVDQLLESSTAAGMQRMTNMEDRLRNALSDLHKAKYDNENLRATVSKMERDLHERLRQVSDYEVAMSGKGNELDDLNGTLRALDGRSKDIESEREYYRLNTDRLKVENSMLTVKVAQLEAKANTDRAAVMTLERQCATQLDQMDELRRDKDKLHDAFVALDDADTRMRRENKGLVHELERIHTELSVLRESYHEIALKYDAVRGHEDAVRVSQQLGVALARLDQTKAEMHNLLQTQVKLSNDITLVMGEIPDPVVRQAHERSVISAGGTPARERSAPRPGLRPSLLDGDVVRGDSGAISPLKPRESPVRADQETRSVVAVPEPLAVEELRPVGLEHEPSGVATVDA